MGAMQLGMPMPAERVTRPVPASKSCPKCGRSKPVDEFYRDLSRKFRDNAKSLRSAADYLERTRSLK